MLDYIPKLLRNKLGGNVLHVYQLSALDYGSRLSLQVCSPVCFSCNVHFSENGSVFGMPSICTLHLQVLLTQNSNGAKLLT